MNMILTNFDIIWKDYLNGNYSLSYQLEKSARQISETEFKESELSQQEKEILEHARVFSNFKCK